MRDIYQKNKPMLTVMLLIGIFFTCFSARYTFGINNASTNCLYTSFFLVDKWDKEVKPGDLAAFYMTKENRFYPAGMQWVKRVAATGGDHVSVFRDRVIVNNSTVINHSMDVVLHYGKISFDDIKPEVDLAQGELFMMGETPTTYDSRYWGAIKQSEIIGKAYAIL